jgi:hypothetical protein
MTLAAVSALGSNVAQVAAHHPSLSPGLRYERRYFGALRRPHRSYDRLPKVERPLWRHLRKQYRLRVGAARRTLVAARGPVWLIPGTGWLCLDVADQGTGGGSATCNRSSAARRGLVVVAEYPHEKALILTGVVPDRSHGLKVLCAGRRSQRLMARNNTYRVSFSPAELQGRKPRRVSFEVRGRRHSLTIPGIHTIPRRRAHPNALRLDPKVRRSL